MGVKGTGNRSGSIPAKEHLMDIWSSFKANPQRRRQWVAVGIGGSAMLRAGFAAIRVGFGPIINVVSAEQNFVSIPLNSFS